MVGKRNRTTNRQSWEQSDMEKAINAIKNKAMGWAKAAKTFNVPAATLRRRAANKNKKFNGVEKGLGRYQPTFNGVLEREIVNHLKLLESRLFGMTVADLRRLAFQVAEQNGMTHRFNKDKKMAGWDWVAGFKKRNPDIRLRKPEPTSAARAIGFNRPVVRNFFQVYEETLEKYNIPQGNIYNVDESSLTTVQNPPKVFAQVGKKQVGAVTSAERGIHTTVVCCMSPNRFVPPMMIFPRKNWKHELTDGAPFGTLGVAQESGWMTGEIFLRWLRHFVDFVKPCLENRVLLVVDGHASHKHVDVLRFAKDKGIIMVCLPPHCTHRMQPLDVAFYGPLKTYYNQEVTAWLKNNPGRTVTQFQIAPLFNKAYGKAATLANAASGFLNCGLYPINSDIFPEYLFAPAETTNRAHAAEEVASANLLVAAHNATAAAEDEHMTIEVEGENEFTDDVADVEPTQIVTSVALVTTNKSVSLSPVPKRMISVAEISPVPSCSGVRNPTKRKQPVKAPIHLNSSPYIEEQKEKEIKKMEKERRTAANKARKALCKNKDEFYEETLFEGDEVNDEDDAACLYCNEVFSRSKAGALWIQCQQCTKWAHIECAGLQKKVKGFICELCLD